MQTPEQIAKQIWRDLNYEGREEHVCRIIAAALQSYGDERAAAERERCARLCVQEAEYARSTALDATDSSIVFVRRTQMGTAAALAAAIRATPTD